VRDRAIEGEFPYVYLDGVIWKRSWAGEMKNVSVLVAIGVGHHALPDSWVIISLFRRYKSSRISSE